MNNVAYLKYSTLDCGNCSAFAEHHTGGSFVAEWYRYDLAVSAFQLLESCIAYSVVYLRFIGGNYLYARLSQLSLGRAS